MSVETDASKWIRRREQALRLQAAIEKDGGASNPPRSVVDPDLLDEPLRSEVKKQLALEDSTQPMSSVPPASGFAGLSAYVSNVDDAISSAAESKAPQARTVQGATTAQASSGGGDVQRSRSDAPPADGGSGKAWLFWLVVIGLPLVLVFIESTNKTRTYSPSATETASSYPPTADQAETPIEGPQRPTEERPAVGTNNVLYGPQIRYCLAEDIRIDAANRHVDNYSENDVARFNAMVTDYNSRCGAFRYRSGSLESAKSEIETYRSVLEEEGRARLVDSSKGQPATDREEPPIYEDIPGEPIFSSPSEVQAAIEQVPPSQTAREANTNGSGRPDISSASPAEQKAIERACNDTRTFSGPAAYYNCLRREVGELGSGRPDISSASPAEQKAIERACNDTRTFLGPGAYYECLRREFSSLGFRP